MINLVKQHVVEVEELCRKYRVRSLELFGSAASDAWDATHSDLDFLVDFLPLGPGEYFEFYFGLLADLRALFARHIDLITVRAIKNPSFAQSVNQSRQVLYA
ncbi:MAG TPA: nucleotidyltransferase domain-containing protein, partial [Pirellulales bacterium]|nr:nucleotidyltransferase domain-containing protein [Pirellulales bacterium]